MKKLLETFESDWTKKSAKADKQPDKRDEVEEPTAEMAAASPKEVAKAVGVFTKELQPLATAVKKAVRQAVVKAGDDVLHDKDVKDTMKRVVKQAVKVKPVKEAVHEAQEALSPRSAA